MVSLKTHSSAGSLLFCGQCHYYHTANHYTADTCKNQQEIMSKTLNEIWEAWHFLPVQPQGFCVT